MIDRPSARPLFPLFELKCPHCSEVAIFSLACKQYERLGLGWGREYFFQCSRCQFDRDVENGEAEAWQKLRVAYDGYSRGKLEKEKFAVILAAIEEPDLRDFFEEAETWNCSCGEENPGNFSGCWKCGEESPEPVRDSTSKPVDVGGREPWEM